MFDFTRCLRELAEEKRELEGLRAEHRELAEQAVRQAGTTRASLEGVAILMTAAEIERLFANRAHERAHEQARNQASTQERRLDS